jgi:zinc transporter ZupT
MAELLTVTAIALGTALATGLGALPLALARGVTDAWVGRGDGLAAGLMLGASGGLLWEGAREGAVRTGCGLVAGFALIALAARLAGDRDDVVAAPGSRAPGVSGAFLVAVMTLHSCAEGVGVGVAFGGPGDLGVLVAIAIAVHNVPEGLAISLVLVPRGASVLRAAWWSVFSSLPQPLLALPAYLLVEHVAGSLPVGFGAAAGAMAWMAGAQLVPDALRRAPRRDIALLVGAGAGAMVALQAALV